MKIVCKIIIIGVLALCCGCRYGGAELDRSICPPTSTSKRELLDNIAKRQSHLTEFAAKGSARVHFISDNRTETLNNVTAYFSDSNNALVRGAHTFGTAIILGTNNENFWCWINFSKVNDFYYGNISTLKSCGARGFKTFPIAEAFGIIDVEALTDADLFFGRGEFGFILTDENLQSSRSYSFDNCSGELIQITYYDNDLITATAQFSDYQPLNEHMSLPQKTTIYSVNDAITLEFTMSRIMELSLSNSRREKLYAMPSTSADTSVYYLNQDCEFEHVK